MKTVLIIPYRDRESHLEYFLKESWSVISKDNSDMEIIVVEQTKGKKFNRGKVINVGYKYYDEKGNDYITQDVDVNPIKKEIIDMYKEKIEENVFMGIYSDGRTLGGIVKFKGSTFEKVNGFPNDYWGWGHEDKDLSNRAEHYKCKIERKIKYEDKDKGEYLKIFEDNHVREDCGKWGLAYGVWDKVAKEEQERYIENNGLSTLNYTIVSEEKLMNNVKKITVEI